MIAIASTIPGLPSLLYRMPGSRSRPLDKAACLHRLFDNRRLTVGQHLSSFAQIACQLACVWQCLAWSSSPHPSTRELPRSRFASLREAMSAPDRQLNRSPLGVDVPGVPVASILAIRRGSGMDRCYIANRAPAPHTAYPGPSGGRVLTRSHERQG